MAALARRTWDTMRDEVMTRLGRSGVTAFESRAEYLLDGVYRLLCQTWHHRELDKISPELTLSSTTSEVPLPSDLYLPIGARLLDNSSNLLAWLQPRHARALLARDRSDSGKPSYYAIFGSKLYTDKAADTTYKIVVFYYANPTTPDFAAAAASPEINQVFDELLIEWAVALGQNALWRPELGQVNLQTMTSFLGRMGHPILALGGTSDNREEPTDDKKLAGVLG